MIRLRGHTLIATILMLTAPALAEDEGEPSFVEHVGDWVVAGDERMSACVAWRLTNDRATKLTLASAASRSTVRIALANPAWRSLPDSDNLRITATFVNAQSKITDMWDLSTTSSSTANDGPRILFDIDRASNDRSSFIDQFKKAHAVWFWKGEVPIAKFDLQRSSAMIDSLFLCRAKMRIDDDFDPFAK